MSVRLFAENYRVLRKIDWELPKGVCGLVGPNGSGKTTLLNIPGVLRDIFANGVWGGLSGYGDVRDLRNVQASPGEVVKLQAQLDTIRWELEIRIDEQGRPTYSETVQDRDALVFSKPHELETELYPSRGGAKGTVNGSTAALRLFASDRFASPDKARLLPPISHLCGYRLYAPYNLATVRSGSAFGDPVATFTHLLPGGDNVFTLLRNWRDRRATRSRYEFVIQGLREAFPDIFDELELDANERLVTGSVFAPHHRMSLPIFHAPSGLLTGLLHLAGVASTEGGGLVAIDEPENGLHPHAVKRLVQSMREWADQEDITILLATHSPMLLDQFKQDPEHLFVMEPGQDVLPVRLDRVRNREWLGRFSLGDLYKAGDFGAPKEEGAAA